MQQGEDEDHVCHTEHLQRPALVIPVGSSQTSNTLATTQSASAAMTAPAWAGAIFGRRGLVHTVRGAGISVTAALALDDVVLAGATLDGLTTVVGFVEPGDEEAPTAAWHEALGGTEVVYRGTYREGLRPEPLGPLGWRVLASLIERPRASLTDHAEATSLTWRTVRDRRTRLLETGAVEVTPVLGPSSAGRLLFHLAVMGYDGTPQALARELGPALVSERATGPERAPLEAAVLFCEAGSLAEQHGMVERARGLAGVERVIAYLIEDYRVHTERLLGWIERELERWEAARRGSA